MLNDAISEAYYSMFHAASAILSLKDSYPRNHKGLISEFGLQFVASGSIEDSYGKLLALAEDEREKQIMMFITVPQQKKQKLLLKMVKTS